MKSKRGEMEWLWARETSVRRRRGALLIFQSLDGNEAIVVSDDVKMLTECFWLLMGTA